MWMPAAGSHNLRFASFWVLVCGFWLLLGRAKTASIGDFSSFSRPIIASFWSLMISTNPHNLRHFIRPAVSFGLRLFAFWLHSCVSGCPGCTHVDACGRLPYARARSRSYARGRFLAGVRAYVFATHMRLHLAVTSHALVFASCSCSPVWKSASEARYPRFFLDFIVRGESRRLSDARPCALYARVRLPRVRARVRAYSIIRARVCGSVWMQWMAWEYTLEHTNTHIRWAENIMRSGFLKAGLV